MSLGPAYLAFWIVSACGRTGKSFFDCSLLLTDVDGRLSRDDFWREGSQLLDLKLLEVLRCKLCASALALASYMLADIA